MVLKPIERWAGEGPGFDRPLAEAVYATIAKMDADEAVMFSRLIADAVLQDDLLVHGQLIAKTVLAERAQRAEAIKKQLARSAVAKARRGLDADAELVALTELSKAFPFDLFNPQKRAERTRRQARSAATGEFVRESHPIVMQTRTPFTATRERQLGITPPPVTGEGAWALSKPELAAYQQAYHQVSELVKPYQRMPQGSALLHLVDNLGQSEIHPIPHGENEKLPPSYFDPREGRTIEGLQISVIPPADEKGAYFSLFDALGFPAAGAVTAGATDGGALDPKRVNAFGRKWHEAAPNDQFIPSQKVFRRLHEGSQLITDTLGDVAPPPAKMALATARHVAMLGPQVHTVVAPTLDRAAYRYRGTERKPDPALQLAIETDARSAGRKATVAQESFKTLRESAQRRDALLNRNYRAHSEAADRINQDWTRAALNARNGLISRGQLKDTAKSAQRELRRLDTAKKAADEAAHAEHAGAVTEHQRQLTRGAAQHQARTSEIIARGEVGDNNRWHPGEVLGYMKAQVPDPAYNELHLRAGTVPPSEGIILNDKNEVVSQAVGYGEDHYTPFPLRSLRKLRGGSYIRTRTWGGPTAEDIRTALLSGARQLSVVSNNGVFNIRFDPTFTGGRRHNDKAHRMIGRYEHLLDAIRSSEVSRAEFDTAKMDELRTKAGRRFNEERDPTGFTKELNRLKDAERKNPTLSTEQADEAAEDYLRGLASEHGAKGADTSTAQLIQEIADRQARAQHGQDIKLIRDHERYNTEHPDRPLQALDAPPSLEVIRQQRVDALTQAEPQRQAALLAAEFGASAGYTAHMERARLANKESLARLRLDGPGYEAAMQALKEQFPYYIADTRFYRWGPQREDTGYVRPGAARPGAAQAGFGGDKVAADTVRGQQPLGRPFAAPVVAAAAAAATPATETGESSTAARERVSSNMIKTLLAQTNFGPKATLGVGDAKVSIADSHIVDSLNMSGANVPAALKPFYFGDMTNRETDLLNELERNAPAMHAKIGAALKWFTDNTADPDNAEWAAAVKDFHTSGRAAAASNEDNVSRMLRRPDREYTKVHELGIEYQPHSGATTEEIGNAYLADPQIGDLVKAKLLPATIGASPESMAAFKASADALARTLAAHESANEDYRQGPHVGQMPYDEVEFEDQVRGLVQAHTLQHRFSEADRTEKEAYKAKMEQQARDVDRAQAAAPPFDFSAWSADDLANPDKVAAAKAGMDALLARRAGGGMVLDQADPGLAAADALELQRARDFAQRQGGGS